MRAPRFTHSLHIRVMALFLLLLALSGGAYAWWVNTTILRPSSNPVADHWWNDLAEGEIDSLGLAVATHVDDPVRLSTDLTRYGARVRAFEAEVAVVDSSGQVMATSAPESLAAAIGEIDPQLLSAMARPDWDFDSYPDPTSFDAYVNRIFQVEALPSPGDSTIAQGYLVATFMPVTITPAELQTNFRQLWVQAIVIMLAAGALSGLIVMVWLSRRVRTLSHGVAAFAEGEFTRRVPATSGDDLGRLGRNFNTMASHLETLIQELRNKEQFQRQLIANISHDLRSPMAALRGYVETLVLRGDRLDAQERDRYLEIISGNLDHLDHLVDHLLQLSRLDAGQARFQMEEFSLPELLDGVLARCAALAERKGLTLRADVPDDLPLVHADPLQIAQVLQNLVDNGTKFNHEGGEVVVSAANVAGRVSVAVRDNGEGIAPEILPRIFDRFYTADVSRHRKGESNGLGLAISQKIVQGHGSEIRVTSQQNQGSIFTFELPAAEALQSDAAKG